MSKSSFKSPSVDDPATAEIDEKIAAKADAAGRPVIDTSAAPPSSDNEYDDEDDELAIEDDEEDEDLVVFTAKEAAGALATVYVFIKPFLKNYPGRDAV